MTLARAILPAAAIALLPGATPPAAVERIAWVSDGDTVRLASGERIRIAGIDAAESDPRNAKCAAELARGRRATRDATALLKGKAVTVTRVGRSYNRTVAKLRLDGRDVAATLVAAGIARGRRLRDRTRVASIQTGSGGRRVAGDDLQEFRAAVAQQSARAEALRRSN